MSLPRPHLRPALALLAILIAIHGVALGVTARRLGSVDGYAFRSSDAAEYYELAQSIRRGEYRRGGVPDTWRVPVYPMFLAGAMAILGPFPSRLVLLQHGLAAINVVLFYAAAGTMLSRRRAMAAAGLWATDPFRVYYAGWLLAESLFLTWVIAAGIVWQRCRRPVGLWGVALLGALLGLAMLTRPIGCFLPVAAVAGLLLRRQIGWGRRLRDAAVCLAATGLVVGPWLVRNYRVTGRVAISQQSGVSLAYFKVVEVLVWQRGLTEHRFDPQVLRVFMEAMDRRLQAAWAERYGPLSPEQRNELVWSNLIYGNVRTVNAVDLSRVLWRIGMDMLADRPLTTFACYAARMTSMLTFPLAIGLWPPAKPQSAPFATILGESRPLLARAAAVVLGAAFAALGAAATVRVMTAIRRGGRFGAWFAVVAAVLFVLLTVPFEDPRFREPIVPLLLVIALTPQPRPPGADECKA